MKQRKSVCPAHYVISAGAFPPYNASGVLKGKRKRKHIFKSFIFFHYLMMLKNAESIVFWLCLRNNDFCVFWQADFFSKLFVSLQ